MYELGYLMMTASLVLAVLFFIAYKFPRIGIALALIGTAFSIYCFVLPREGFMPDLPRNVGYFALGYATFALIVGATRIYTRKRAVAHAA